MKERYRAWFWGTLKFIRDAAAFSLLSAWVAFCMLIVYYWGVIAQWW